MQALSARQPWASQITEGKKTIGPVPGRRATVGPLLIYATREQETQALPTAAAICVVAHAACRPLPNAPAGRGDGWPLPAFSRGRHYVLTREASWSRSREQGLADRPSP